ERGQLGIGGSKRYASQGHRHGAALGLTEVGPRHALPRHRRAPVVAAVPLQHDAGDRQAVSVVERVVAIAVSAPPPTAQTMASWSVASNVTFEARRMGTSEVVRAKKRVWDGSRLETILFWPFLGLGCAPTGGPTIEPLSVAELAGLAEVAFADATAVPIETLVAAASAEGAVLILNRFGKPRPALEIAAVMARLHAHAARAPRRRVHHFEVDEHEGREPALVLARAHDARSRDCCHRRLFATVMPNRLGDSRVTIGPPGALRMRRPVRLLIRFSAHHSGNVRTWLSFKSAGSTMVGSIRLKPPPPDCLRLLRCLRRNIDEHPHVGILERVDAQKQTSPPEHRVARCASSGPGKCCG